MVDPVITNVNLGSFPIKNAAYQDDILTLAGADTIAKGTILARDSVSLNLVLYVKGGSTNENGIPKAILTSELVVTGADDFPVRVCIAGEVDKGLLIIDADGDDSNIDAAVRDELRDYGIVPLDVAELNFQDNQ